jgi:guanosine-3',5'-bis(diphosphate) 3'-pyrophosphohydrolase
VLLEAASFAARAHRHQVRKDGQTPYIAHPFRVCLVVRHVFGIDDPDTLAIALLHDTIEDTTTDYDNLAERFGDRVAAAVAVLSKDMRLPEDERESAYVARLSVADATVKIAKLGDLYDNLSDSGHLSPRQRLRTVERCRQYLAALEQNATDAVRKPLSLVRALLDRAASEG